MKIGALKRFLKKDHDALESGSLNEADEKYLNNLVKEWEELMRGLAELLKF